MHNRQTEIAVLAVCDFVTYEAGLATVSTGTDKSAAECVPIMQKNGGLSVYQAFGGTDVAVPPKQVERQFGDVRSMTTGLLPYPAVRITGTPKQTVSGKACAGCMKAFCRITTASTGLMPKLSMAGCKVEGWSQKRPAPSGR